MPGIDFAQVRALVSLLDVLNLIGFVPSDGFSVKVSRPLSYPSFHLSIEPQLLR